MDITSQLVVGRRYLRGDGVYVKFMGFADSPTSLAFTSECDDNLHVKEQFGENGWLYYNDGRWVYEEVDSLNNKRMGIVVPLVEEGITLIPEDSKALSMWVL